MLIPTASHQEDRKMIGAEHTHQNNPQVSYTVRTCPLCSKIEKGAIVTYREWANAKIKTLVVAEVENDL